jgi:hypothetical protein
MYTGWRFVPTKQSINIIKKLVDITVDPNILPPTPNPRTKETEALMTLYTPRVAPKLPPSTPSMMMITLQDVGEDLFPSGYLLEGSPPEPFPHDRVHISTRCAVPYKNCPSPATSPTIDFTVRTFSQSLLTSGSLLPALYRPLHLAWVSQTIIPRHQATWLPKIPRKLLTRKALHGRFPCLIFPHR